MSEQLSILLQRIEERLFALNLSADEASRAAGKPDAIRNMRRAVREGHRGVNLQTVTALAAALHTSPAWLLEGYSDNPADAFEVVLSELRTKRDELDHAIKTLEAWK